MRKIILSALFAITLGIGPIAGAIPAFAGVSYNQTAVGCAGVTPDVGYSTGTWGSSANVTTENFVSGCYYVIACGSKRFANATYIFRACSAGNWIGGAPGSVSWIDYGNFVEAAGTHNLCLSDWSGCNGFVSTLAYQ